MNLELIKTLAEERRIAFKSLAALIGMSEGNLHRCVRENKIQAGDLEKLAIQLKVNVGVFFDEPATGVHVEGHGHSKVAGRDMLIGANTAELARLQERIAHLEERLADKDVTIAEKDERIKDKDQMIEILKSKMQ